MGRSRALGSVRELPGAAEACGDPPRLLSEFQLQRYHLTQEEYAKRAAQQLKAREACLAAMRDPALSPAQKHDTEARYRLTWGASLFKCKGCMLPPALCVCPALARVSLERAPEGVHPLPPLRVAVYMHQKEHGRASNTGCLLAPSLGATIYLSGLAEHEAELAAMLSSSSSSSTSPADEDDDAGGEGGVCAVLWPSEESLSLEQLRAATPPARWACGLTLLVLDSTWAGARKLLHRLPPGALRLRMDALAFDPGRSLLYPARQYSGQATERHCTYEAVVAVLDALGALRGGERQALLLNLKLKIDALLCHKNRRPAYGKDTAEALAAARELALRQIAAE